VHRASSRKEIKESMKGQRRIMACVRCLVHTVPQLAAALVFCLLSVVTGNNNTSGVGRGGTGTLKVDGNVVSTEKLEASLPLVKPLDIAFDVGLSGANPVDDRDYKVPFDFTGKINKVTIALDPPKLTPEDVKKLEAAGRAASD
jgi:hypothetical protein